MEYYVDVVKTNFFTKVIYVLNLCNNINGAQMTLRPFVLSQMGIRMLNMRDIYKFDLYLWNILRTLSKSILLILSGVSLILLQKS